MANVTLRSTTGSALTWSQMDTNFSNLSNSTPISVKEFGAVGDGVTDDTSAVHSARDYLVSIGGGTLYFPPGDYAGNFVLRKWVKWVGEYNATTLYPYDTTKPVFRSPVTADGFSTDGFDPSGTNYYHLTRFGIDGFLIDGNDTHTTYAIDISPQAESFADGFDIRNITMQNIYQGIKLHGLNPIGADADTSFLQNGAFRNIRIESSSSQKEALMIEGVILETHFDVVYIHFDGSGVSPVTIKKTSTGTGSIKRCGRVSFQNLVVDRESSGGVCVSVTAGRNIQFLNCYIEGSATGYQLVPGGDTSEDQVEGVQIIGGSVSSQTTQNIILGSATTDYVTKGTLIDGVRFRPSTGGATNAIKINGGTDSNRNVTIGNANIYDETDGTYSGDYVTVLSYATASGATPDLSYHNKHSWSDTGTEITDFTNYSLSKEYTFYVNSVSSPSYIKNSGNFTLSKPWYPRTAGDSITLERFASKWREKSRNQAFAKLTHSATGSNLVVDPSGYDVVSFNHASTTNVIEFDGNGVYEGMTVGVRALTANTTITHNSGSATNYPILNESGADFNLATGKLYRYQLIDSVWRPVSESA